MLQVLCSSFEGPSDHFTTVVNALLHEQQATLSSRACHSKTPVHAYVVPHKLPACQVAACSGVISAAD